MHISEGILSGPVIISGVALTALGTGIGLRKVDYDRIPQVSVLSAAFFVASLVHVPIGPSSVHLILNGLMGLFLGLVSFPAILVGLILQAVLFQFGGITTLGVNSIIMALPAVLCYMAFSPLIHKQNPVAIIAAFACGFLAVFLGAVLVGLALIFTEENFWEVSVIVVVAHLPVMIIEGIVTAICVAFLRKSSSTVSIAPCRASMPSLRALFANSIN